MRIEMAITKMRLVLRGREKAVGLGQIRALVHITPVTDVQALRVAMAL